MLAASADRRARLPHRDGPRRQNPLPAQASVRHGLRRRARDARVQHPQELHPDARVPTGGREQDEAQGAGSVLLLPVTEGLVACGLFAADAG